MDAAYAYQMAAFFLIVLLQIGKMLEVVGVQITTLYYLVGHDIIVKYSYLKVISFLCQDRFCLLQDLCMWGCRCCYFDRSEFTCGLCLSLCCLCGKTGTAKDNACGQNTA